MLGKAVLGLLARESLSGYDLAGKLRKPVGFFWHARHSQIYPELRRLAEAGLVSQRRVDQTGRPDKVVYSITSSGLAVLRAWLTGPLPEASARDELVLRAYSLWLTDPESAAAFMRDQERRHRGRLAEYEGYRADIERSPEVSDPGTPLFATYATLVRGIGYERELADWCAWLADRLVAAREG